MCETLCGCIDFTSNLSHFCFCLAGFPNRAVVDAYTRPEINESRAKFSWTNPNVDALKDFLNEKIGWNREKFNSVVVPVLERFRSKEVSVLIVYSWL